MQQQAMPHLEKARERLNDLAPNERSDPSNLAGPIAKCRLHLLKWSHLFAPLPIYLELQSYLQFSYPPLLFFVAQPDLLLFSHILVDLFG